MNTDDQAEAYDANMLIGGEWIAGTDRLTVFNPAHPTEVVGTIARSTPQDVDRAVVAAKAAQPAWARLSFAERAAVLGKALDRLESGVEDRAALLTRENGKTLAEARSEIVGVPKRLPLMLALADEFDEDRAYDAPNGKSWVKDLPYGVVVSIVPWNSPLSLGFAQVFAALFAGNAVVLKPPESAPLALIRSVGMISEVLPSGLLNVVTGLPAEIGDALTGHEDVGKIGFTGSVASARQIMGQAAATLKSVTFELGGNDAAIVLDDADLSPEMLRRMAKSVFRMSGQVCMAIKRIYVHTSLQRSFVDAFRDVADALVVGDGLDSDVTMGPLHTAAALDRARTLLADAQSRGAETRVLGHIANPAHFDGGHFMRPTIVTGLADDAPLVREEQFCAAVPILTFQEDDEAVARANASIYGLGASVWGRDRARALDVAERLEASTVFVNTHGTGSINRTLPYGGVKQSGIGCKSGREGVHEYLQVRSITTFED